MRHRCHRAQLGRPTGPRKALIRALAEALITHGRIYTTAPKAKALRPVVEKLVTLGREGSQHSRRQAFALLQKKQVVHALFTDYAARFKDRQGGYTRIVNAGQREGDGAWMAFIEFVDYVPPKIEARTKAPAPSASNA